MRLVTYGAACSLDGFIAGSDGSIDWLHFSPDVSQIMAAYWKNIDTVIMGRKTWEAAAAMGGGGMPGMKGYVFSKTLDRITRKGVELVRGDAAEFVGQLKAQPGKDICVLGGAELAGALLGAGVVDEIGFNIHPIVLGSGIPLFRDPERRVALELKESRVIGGGCVYVLYRVQPGK
jgi:dihydrofolate reductase